MGQETSTLVTDSTPTQTLSDRSVKAVADLIKRGGASKIVVMTGAGISTAAGIPDFRSPKTGLYHNLAKLNLPHPEAVFELDFFAENPHPFYMLAKELYPGNFKPTVSHAFIALLARKRLLRMLFTQNIDCLEREVGVPAEKIVEAHGSFANQRCIECKTPFPHDEMRDFVARGVPPTCKEDGCRGYVKPDIVFFGEQLPARFYIYKDEPGEADLVIVLGTSLQVFPFAGLPRLAAEGTPRLLINMERVGDMGTRADDVLCLGDCDAGVRKLAEELGWSDELEESWEKCVGLEEAKRQRAGAEKRNADMEDELDKLVAGVGEKLDISDAQESEGGVANAGTGQALPRREEEKGEGAARALAAVDGASTGDDAAEGAEAQKVSTEGKAEEGGKAHGENKAQVSDLEGVASYVPVQGSTENKAETASPAAADVKL
ncbi:NAD-dependent deacetylase sirtuin-2 [Xylariaceae sp. FL0016]|nr:NAD-dependent deacetylase sirtuin-2 [Xylariaceae sp. FL0016]